MQNSPYYKPNIPSTQAGLSSQLRSHDGNDEYFHYAGISFHRCSISDVAVWSTLLYPLPTAGKSEVQLSIWP